MRDGRGRQGGGMRALDGAGGIHCDWRAIQVDLFAAARQPSTRRGLVAEMRPGP